MDKTKKITVYDSIEKLLKNHTLLEINECLSSHLEKEIKGRDCISDPEKVINFVKSKIGSLHYENFMTVFTNVKNEVLAYEIINEGTIDQAIIYPRRVIEKAMFHDATGIILFHNHPSGHCLPSEADKVITHKLKDYLLCIDVKLLDHIIVSKTDYYSFQEEGTI